MLEMRRVLIVLCISVQCFALYEDQIGKYDWTKHHIGKVDLVTFEKSISLGKSIFVSTDKNVLACINAKNGQLMWRKTLGKTDGKMIQLIHSKDGLFTIGQSGLVRMIQPANGVPKWEINLASTVAEKGEEFSIFQAAVLEQSYTQGNLLVISSTVGIHTITISRNNPKVKTVALDQASANNKLYVDSETGKIIHLELIENVGLALKMFEAKQLEEESHATINDHTLLSFDHVTVLEGNRLAYVGSSSDSPSLYLVDMIDGRNVNSIKLELLDITDTKSLVNTDSTDITACGKDFIIRSSDSKITLIKIEDNDIQVGWTKDIPHLNDVVVKRMGSENYALYTTVQEKQISAFALSLKSDTGSVDEEITIKYKLPPNVGNPASIHLNMFLKRTTPVGFRLLVTTAADTVIFVSHPNRAVWQLDEALASVTHATMLDLPLSDGDAGIEAEFDEAERVGVIKMFAKRIRAQTSQFVAFMKQTKKEIDAGTLFQHKTRDPLIQVEGLTRDPFSLHKLIVTVTKSGSLFGIDSLNGDVVWRFYCHKLAGRKIQLHIQRTTAHFPHPPQALIVGIDPSHQTPPVLLQINPITGEVAKEKISLDIPSSRILQATLLSATDSTHLRPLLVMDSEFNLRLVPENADTAAVLKHSNLYMYDIDPEKGLIRGFAIRGASSKAEPTWTVNVPDTHKIINFAGKLPGEKIDSVGRPLADRSVMFKYLNPNAVAVLSESLDKSVDRCSLSLLLIDAVTGQILHSMLHKKASGPVHIVHSENWLIYSYRNAKMRRNEISSLEMYEGKSQFNSTAFSSFHNRPTPPLVLQQAYIFPTGISSIGCSRTDKGITTRQMLFGLSRGSLFGIHRRMFDPRRSLHPPDKHREEGIIPYAPEIPVPPEFFLSYNLTLEGLEGVYSAPSALESTSLIFATGLDLFFTRSQPSKMFDVLKEDFDHFFISAVLVGMLVAAIATRRLSQIKQLNKSWR